MQNASPSGDAESRMMGDVDEEVGDNDKNAMVWPEGAAWWDSFCADAISSDFVKETSQCDFICEKDYLDRRECRGSRRPPIS
jgi:hypothetical protein